MSPSVKKRPEIRVISKKQDKESQDIVQKPVSTVIERNRLKMVIKNLSLLKVLKSSNPRIQEMHTLAKRCWESLIRVPRTPRISSRTEVHKNVKQNNAVLQGAMCPKKKLRFKGETEEPEGSKPKEKWGKRNKTKESPAVEPQKEEQVELEVPRTSRDRDLITSPGAQGRRPPLRDPRVVFLKIHRHRTPKWDPKQPEEAGQWIWFEGLPHTCPPPGAQGDVQIVHAALGQALLYPLLLCIAGAAYVPPLQGVTWPLPGQGETQPHPHAEVAPESEGS